MRLTKGKGCLFALIVMPLLVWGIYKYFYPTYRWHEKMTASVQTQSGVKTGSAVRWVEIIKHPKLLPEMGSAETDFKGEAIVIKLDDKRYLFALLGSPIGWLESAYKTIFPKRENEPSRGLPYWESSVRNHGPVILQRIDYPRLVTFDDINDPASVKLVDPDDMDAALGCDKLSSEAKPWREEGITWRQWKRREEVLKVVRSASEGIGLSKEDAEIMFRIKMDNLFVSEIPELGPEYNLTKEEAIALKAKLSQDYSKIKRKWQRKWIEGMGQNKYAYRLNWDAKNFRRDNSNDCHKLKSITLEITDEPITQGKVEEVLRWLGPYPEPALGAKSAEKPIPFYRQVFHGDFIRR